MRCGWVVGVVWAVWCGGVGFAWDQVGKCHRTPLGTEFPRTPGDNEYKIKISGNPEKYVPGEVYTVSLQGWRTQYAVRKFTGFMLVVEPSLPPKNHYGPQSVGTFQLYGDALTMHSDDCPNAVIQTSSISKSEIQVLWTAPPADSGCVTFRATVVENRDLWFMDDGELTKELCEEVQDNVNMQPDIISDCCACDEAKYEVTFEGLWSRHTHPKDFPSNEWLTHFSDIIGASHSANYRVWQYGGYSSDGLSNVAKWGSTRTLESELKQQSDHIRTIIKARGLWHPNLNGKTFAVFRVDNRHHLMSLVSMIGPSPDWIVGVSALELCLSNCSWVDQKTLNLYPWDVGTDSGVTYESPDSPTIPREKIQKISNSHPNDPKSPFYDPTGLPMKPLAQLTITRQRVYEKSCSDTSSLIDLDGGYIEEDDDVSKPECQVNNWTHWTQCSVTCGNGIRMRNREYIMPMKADMAACRRQMVEKEMCAGVQTFCPGDNLDGSFGDDPRYCGTTEWSPWTSCSVTCGKGIRMRSRRFLDRMGRKKCKKSTTDREMCMADMLDCEGAPEEEEISAECSVTTWSEWSPCSVTCGTGSTLRTRSYLLPSISSQPDCGVKTMDKKECFGERQNCTIAPSERDEVCRQKSEQGPCRGSFRRWYYDGPSGTCKGFRYGGCRSNRNNFESYAECMAMCNMAKGPAPTTENPIMNKADNHMLEKVDCMATPWSVWSSCSVTCGIGRKEKRRMIKVEPANGGKRCPRRLQKYKRCIKQDCVHDFNGLKSMSQIREEPMVPFEPEVRYRPYYEHGPTHYVTSDEYSAPGLFNPPPLEDFAHPPPMRGGPVEDQFDDGTKADCMMAEWGPWSPCTQSCGDKALQQRSRTIIVSPRNGGTPCGDRLERRYCTLPPCPRSRG